MIDLDTIEYYEYMKKQEEQEELEDKIFYKIMDIHLEEESKEILEEINRRKSNGEAVEIGKEESRKRVEELWKLSEGG